uniref:Facilitated trehalose transporter Tret1 n=1 Tax=Lygus hesperus TaxID=30085 RepID=A0A0A9YBE0_LYGHE
MLSRFISFGFFGEYVAAFVVSIASFVSGLMMGLPDAVIPQLTSGAAGFTLTESEISVMLGIMSAGSFVSPLPSGYFMDHIGRRNSLILFNLLTMISWVLLVVSKTPFPIYVAKFITGMWVSFEYTAAPVYVGEITSPRLRGSLTSLGELMFFFGVLYTSLLMNLSYETIIVSCAVPSIVLLFGLILIPESPYFYLMKRNRKMALKNLVWLRGSMKAEELDEMESTVNEQLNNKSSFSIIFTSAQNLRAFMLVQCLMVVVGNSSLMMLLSFSTTIFQNTWVSSQNGYIILCCIWIASGIVSCLVIDSVNRKTLLFVSSVGTALALSGTTVWFYLRDQTNVDTTNTSWVPLATLIVAGVFETCGIFNIPTVVNGEVFPVNIKTKAVALSSMTASLVDGINSTFFFKIARGPGLYLNFAKILITTIFCIYFSKYVMIETRGKTLEEIQEDLKKRA